jgi:hypothetical protein
MPRSPRSDGPTAIRSGDRRRPPLVKSAARTGRVLLVSSISRVA